MEAQRRACCADKIAHSIQRGYPRQSTTTERVARYSAPCGRDCCSLTCFANIASAGPLDIARPHVHIMRAKLGIRRHPSGGFYDAATVAGGGPYLGAPGAARG